MQAAALTNILAIVRKPFNERTQEEVHALVVLLTEQLRLLLCAARKLESLLSKRSSGHRYAAKF
jgi:hypothetical protein